VSTNHSGLQQDNEDMCCRVINNIIVHVEQVARHNGGHTEHLIHRGYISMQWFSFCMLVSSIVIEIQILLIGHILDHFVCHPVYSVALLTFTCYTEQFKM
jgi:hypothetical protein